MDKFPKLPAMEKFSMPRPVTPERGRDMGTGDVVRGQPSALPPVSLGTQPRPFPPDRPVPTMGAGLPTPPDSASESLAAIREMMGSDLETEQERIGSIKEMHARNRFAFQNVLGGGQTSEESD